VKIYVDAADPQRTINSNQAKDITRKLCAGFKAVGLKQGDCVCMLSFNDVRIPNHKILQSAKQMQELIT
jgi:long-subunit acyl-CoA synthetase (AMP-forming)